MSKPQTLVHPSLRPTWSVDGIQRVNISSHPRYRSSCPTLCSERSSTSPLDQCLLDAVHKLVEPFFEQRLPQDLIEVVGRQSGESERGRPIWTRPCCCCCCLFGTGVCGSESDRCRRQGGRSRRAGHEARQQRGETLRELKRSLLLLLSRHRGKPRAGRSEVGIRFARRDVDCGRLRGPCDCVASV